MELISTPIELYDVSSIPVWVKREDLCAPEGAPPFSKIRGLYKFLKQQAEQGVRTVGYVETSISMAGWGVAYVTQMLGMKSVIFKPVYKVPHPETDPVLDFHTKQWEKHGAEIIEIPAGRARVNYYKCQKLIQQFPKSILLPLGLPLDETVEETCKEVKKVWEDQTNFRTIVVSVGSGTICAGLYRFLSDKPVTIYGVLCRIGSHVSKLHWIHTKAQVWGLGQAKLKLKDLGYQYTEREDIVTPFPCNPFYDKKAWRWLVDNVDSLKEPILFWNIGR